MELQVYDANFTRIDIIEVFSSMIWTKRYRECGDFEINIPLDEGAAIPSWMRCDNYVSLKEDVEDGYYMVIESIEISADEEEGYVANITGRSLDAILERRIVWEQTAYNAKKTCDIIASLLDSAIISPSIEGRKIENFVFIPPESTDDFSTVNAEYTGDNLLTVIQGLLEVDDYGISILHDDEKDQFICTLHKGTDRSYDQIKYHVVLFSSDMENLLSSSYVQSTKEYKNVILAMGQGTGSARTRYVLGDVSGLDRREYYKDARDVSTSSALEQRANEALEEYKVQELLDGEVTSDLYTYGVDYLVGDIVQVRNGFGIERKARITEVIFSQDTSGINIYPTVEIINEEV